ncbi:glucosamine-6-phosphate deaminase [Paenibacillaceae bacterium WGS1546]|uniref:glucosamine-6-phosphate deaminase n=1 Tax=Cohnella sp. WGS1546 TaxID=3366810 RepID=UPI00372D4AD7
MEQRGVGEKKMDVQVFASRAEMGACAAHDAANRLRELLARQDRVRMVFAAAPSQNEFLERLIREEGIDWARVTAFHMDEYVGLPASAPQLFSRFLRNAIFDRVPFGEVHLIDGNADQEEECGRYSGLLAQGPIDIVCMGIGENGHIAFNDPPVADFRDPLRVKPVELDQACRQQQVNDGCFSAISEVPTQALTLTVPMLMSGKYLYCIVPGPTKRTALRRMLNGEITTACPASILRTHGHCKVYADTEAYGQIEVAHG